MSDLQCPATMLIAAAQTDAGQVHHLLEELGGRRIAAVYGSQMDGVGQVADVAASQLGLQPVFVDGLDERFRQAIDEIADTHRGETVLVFTDSEVMKAVIPLAIQRLMPGDGLVEIEVDGDGWRPAAPTTG